MILTRQYQFCLYNALHSFFRKLILTGCHLDTLNVTVISTDLEHELKYVVTDIFFPLNKTQLVSFLEHMRKSGDRFRIHFHHLVFTGSNHLYIFYNPKNPEKTEDLPDDITWEFAQKEVAQVKGFATNLGAGMSKGNK